MHIEPGLLNAAKVAAANISCLGTLGLYAPHFVKRPSDIAKTLLAAAFFSVFMEIYFVPVGPSELHFIGASAVYFTFGFIPTMFGFAIGLLLQGFLFEPQDLLHLGVNALSLVVPLVATHAALGRRFFAAQDRREVRWASVARFDALYYAGVVAMVGFWLALGNEPTPLASWARFAAAYLPLALCEPVFTIVVLRLLKRWQETPAIQHLTAVPRLAIA